MSPEMGLVGATWLAFLKTQEGLRLTPYTCAGGVWTVGYGHTGPDVTEHSGAITEAQADAWLLADATEAVGQALDLSPSLAGASLPRLSAVADFCYNCGPHNYAKSTFRKCVDAGKWEEAAQQNSRWVFAKGVRRRGLVKRRAVTSTWLLEGLW